MSASVPARLANLARERKENFQELLSPYARERMLYRLSVSEYQDRLLKVALLFSYYARIVLQVDLGFGDRVVPGPEDIEFPALLDFPAPHLKSYTREKVVAEKYEAMLKLGMLKGRMKDFFDL